MSILHKCQICGDPLNLRRLWESYRAKNGEMKPVFTREGIVYDVRWICGHCRARSARLQKQTRGQLQPSVQLPSDPVETPPRRSGGGSRRRPRMSTSSEGGLSPLGEDSGGVPAGRMRSLPSGSGAREESRSDSRSLPTDVEELDRQGSEGRSRGRGSHDGDRYPLRRSRRRERDSHGAAESDPPAGVEIHQIKVAGAAGFLAPLVLFGPFPFLSDMALLTFSLSVPTLCVIGAVYAALRPRPWIASGALLGGFLLGTVLVSMALQAIRH